MTSITNPEGFVNPNLAPLGPAPKTRRDRRSGWAALALVVLAGLALAWFLRPHRHFDRALFPHSLFLEKEDVTLIPESERPMDRVVMGLGPATGEYFALPPLKEAPGLDPKQVKTVQKLLYWLDLEMSHGQVWNHLPTETVIYMGVPVDAQTHRSSSQERDWFKEYLHLRWGWTGEDVRHRIHFFDTPLPIIWGQDIGEVLGRDGKDRVVLATGEGEPEWYRGTALELAKTYPDDFILKETSPPISTEGGDMELVWSPEDKPLVLAGRFAAVRYLQRTRGGFDPAKPASLADYFEAKERFRKNFYEQDVEFLPKACLLDPALGEPELFHLDMVAAILAGEGQARAFVPTYSGPAGDAIQGRFLEAAFQKRIQREFDQAAMELSFLGYQVKRLPFDDHPVRSPANLVKYFDRVRGKQVVLLPKYPAHGTQPGVATAQTAIQSSLVVLQNWTATWRAYPTNANFNGLMGAFNQVWGAMDAAASGANRFFDEQKAVLEACGYEVIPVPMFPWGAGGLHCETLH